MLGDLFNRSARFLCAVLAGSSLSAGEPLRFNQDIRPILSDHCFACHGFDAKKRKADLRLDVAESAFADHDGVRAIVPGKVEESALWERIQSSDDDDIMPPPDFHKPLSPTEKATLKQWIGEGAPYEAHWAFVKPRKADVPQRPGVPFFRRALSGKVLLRLRQPIGRRSFAGPRWILPACRRPLRRSTHFWPTPDRTRGLASSMS
jgi:hypothetical protein